MSKYPDAESLKAEAEARLRVLEVGAVRLESPLREQVVTLYGSFIGVAEQNVGLCPEMSPRLLAQRHNSLFTAFFSFRHEVSGVIGTETMERLFGSDDQTCELYCSGQRQFLSHVEGFVQ